MDRMGQLWKEIEVVASALRAKRFMAYFGKLGSC
jgi:hypothetical protein